MSRIGVMKIEIPEGVTVSFADSTVSVKGPKGELQLKVNPLLGVEITDGKVKVNRQNDEKFTKSIHGTIRALIKNMIEGVVKGYEVVLNLEGIGYRANLEGDKISMTLGYTHPINLDVPKELQVTIDDSTVIHISGIDKQLVGQFAAKIRAYRKPEPYKGKGVHYQGEQILRKTPRAVTAGAAA